MGIYYHFEYVGVPRVYPWMNTNHLPKVAEQMAIVDEWGVDTLWLVNVGDLKPIEVRSLSERRRALWRTNLSA